MEGTRVKEVNFKVRKVSSKTIRMRVHIHVPVHEKNT